MSKLGKKHDELKRLLDQVPGVKEHMSSFHVQMGKQILKRRLELGLTQMEVVKKVQEQGEKITQATVSKVETGDNLVGADTYDKILKALDARSINIEFGDSPKSDHRELIRA